MKNRSALRGTILVLLLLAALASLGEVKRAQTQGGTFGRSKPPEVQIPMVSRPAWP